MSEERSISRQLLLAVIRLARLFRQQSESRLSPAQFSALTTLRTQGPMRLGTLAEHESVALPVMTRTVNALVAAECVQKVPDARDGRALQLTLTPLGMQQLRMHWLGGESRLNERIQSLTASELATLEAAIPVMQKLTEQPAATS